MIQGPEQVANIFNTEPTNLAGHLAARTAAARASLHGNLLTLPIGNSFLYVEPLYVQAIGGQRQYPMLRRVLVSYGNKIGFGEDLAGALSDLQPGAITGHTIDTSSDQTGSPTSTPSPSKSPSPSSTPSNTPAPANEQQVIAALSTAVTELNAAYDSHDPDTINAAQAKVLKLAAQLQQLQTSSAPKPSSSAKPSSPTSSRTTR